VAAVAGLLRVRSRSMRDRPLVHDDDVVDVVAVEVLEQQVADPCVELVDLQGKKAEVLASDMSSSARARSSPIPRTKYQAPRTPRTASDRFAHQSHPIVPGFPAFSSRAIPTA